jgi:hypothetical protein
MSTDEVQILKRSVDELRDTVTAQGGKLDLIHKAVLDMAGKTYVPRSTRSLRDRLVSFLGIFLI